MRRLLGVLCAVLLLWSPVQAQGTLNGGLIVGPASGVIVGNLAKSLTDAYDIQVQSITSVFRITHQFTDFTPNFAAGAWWTIIGNPTGTVTAEQYGLVIESRSAVGNSKVFPYISGTNSAAYHLGTGALNYLEGVNGDATNGNFNDNTGGGAVNIANGVRGKAVNHSASTMVNAHGVYGTVSSALGPITKAYVFDALVENTGPATIDQGVGLNIESPINSGGGLFNGVWGIYIGDQTVAGTSTNYQLYSAGTLPINVGSAIIRDLGTTGAATGKKVVCVDTATGKLYASSTGTDCSN